MPKIHLTDRSDQPRKPGIYFDARTPSFGIRVGASRKTWLVVKGENRTKVRLGHYPSVSLADARKRAFAELSSADTPKQINLSFPDARKKYLAL